MKGNNILIIGLPDEEERVQRTGNLFENIMTKNVPNLVKEKVQEAQGVPNKINLKETHTKMHN